MEKSIFVFIGNHLKDSWLGLFFSGLLGALISSAIMYVTISKNTEEKQMENQLAFRNLFSEKRRWNIHVLLSYIADIKKSADKQIEVDVSDLKSVLDEDYLACVKDKTKLNLDDFEMILEKHIYELYDYMGIFEIADKMVKNGTLDKKLFKLSYLYRIENLCCSKTVRHELDCFPGYWPGFRKLMKIFGDEWK